ncbi:metallopeptidase family protein [Puniceibacterium confluentis]|uniref:metallopeptidase family protein n=1 Tax=Puniceibacterium confluentis TaxID=1958944 RepID=UPI0011B4F72B|nr:metallopeptidase family protein [Puniceibacterium confluentis]
MPDPDRTAPDLLAFEAMARMAIEQLPEAFRAAARTVILRVEDIAPPDVLHDLEIADPLELTGLYDGIPMTEKSFSDPAPWPDTIWLFRKAILAEWRERRNVDLSDLVTHVMVHELAHHFGWSDADIATIDRWWE